MLVQIYIELANHSVKLRFPQHSNHQRMDTLEKYERDFDTLFQFDYEILKKKKEKIPAEELLMNEIKNKFNKRISLR